MTDVNPIPKSVSVGLPPALREALGQVIAEERKSWRQERAVIEAEARASVAEARAALVAVRAEMDTVKAKYEAALELLQGGGARSVQSTGRLQPAPDALRAALVRVIADLERDWRKERDAIQDEARQRHEADAGRRESEFQDWLAQADRRVDAAIEDLRGAVITIPSSASLPAPTRHHIPPGNWS